MICRNTCNEYFSDLALRGQRVLNLDLNALRNLAKSNHSSTCSPLPIENGISQTTASVRIKPKEYLPNNTSVNCLDSVTSLLDDSDSLETLSTTSDSLEGLCSTSELDQCIELLNNSLVEETKPQKLITVKPISAQPNGFKQNGNSTSNEILANEGDTTHKVNGFLKDVSKMNGKSHCLDEKLVEKVVTPSQKLTNGFQSDHAGKYDLPLSNLENGYHVTADICPNEPNLKSCDKVQRGKKHSHINGSPTALNLIDSQLLNNGTEKHKFPTKIKSAQINSMEDTLAQNKGRIMSMFNTFNVKFRMLSHMLFT